MAELDGGTIVDGHYEILAHIGSGGLGTVYRARDVADGAVVAVKMLNISGDEAQRRFLREFNILSRIRHPRVVRPLRWGVYERNPYFAMDFIYGRTLCELLTNTQDWQRLRTSQLLPLVSQIGEGLEYIHRLGFVHQDLKPSNIMVSEADGNLEVTILDLGLARFRASQENLQVSSGTITGTLEYMSPEQIRGRSVDQRSDLYSLGIILYEVLTGKPPFQGGSPHSVMLGHLNESPRPPRAYISGITSEIQSAVMKLVEKEPTKRYNTVGRLLQDLPNGSARSSHIETRAVPTSIGPAAFLVPQFQGREGEMKSLREILRESREGNRHMVIVSGEAGIGKSHVLDEIRADARLHKMRVLSGNCHEGGVCAYGPFVEALLPLTAQQEVQVSDVGKAAKMVLKEIQRPANVSQRDPYPTMEILSEFLGDLSRETPTLFCIEDLQWADELSLKFLDFMSREPNTAPWVFGLTCRKEREGQLPARIEALVTGADAHCVGHFPLEPLSLEETTNLAASILGEPTVPDDEARRIREETGGNPLFTVELVRGAIEGGFIVQDIAGFWTWPRSSEWPMPAGITQAIESRLGRLRSDHRRALEYASIFRGPFSFDLISEVWRGDELRLLEALEGLVRLDLLRAMEDREGRYRFSHGLIQRTVYRGISEKKRELLHLEAGRALEPSFETEGAATLDDVAYHFSRSNDLEKAVRYVTTTGLSTLRMLDFTHAIEQFESVLKRGAFSTDAPADIAVGSIAHLDFLCAYAEALLGCERYEDAGRQLKMVVETESGEVTVRRANALRMLGVIHSHSGDYQESKSMWLEALQLYRNLHDDGNELMILGLLSNADLALGNDDEAVGYCHSAAEKCRESGTGVYEARALIFLAFAADIKRKTDKAKTLLDSALDLLDREGDRFYRHTCLYLLGRIDLRLGYLDVAKDIFQELQAFRWRCGAKGSEAEAHLYLGRIALEQEEIGKAEAHARAAEGLLSIQWRRSKYRAWALLAETLAEAGLADEALAAAERAWPGVEHGGDFRAIAWTAKAKSLAAAGRHDEVDSLFDHVSEVQVSPDGVEQVNLLVVAGAYYLERGRLADARQYLENARAAADRLGLRYYAGKAAGLLDKVSGVVEQTLPEKQMVQALSEKHLLTLYEACEDLTSILNLNLLLDRILDRLKKISRAERVLIALKDEAAGQVEVARKHNLDDAATQEISRGIIQWVMRRNVPILSVDAQLDERFMRRASVTAYGIRSVLCVPLRHAESGVIGALYMDHREHADLLTKKDTALFSAFGNLVSIAVTNARMYSRIEERALYFQKQYEGCHQLEELVGQSEAIRGVFRLVEVAAESNVNVLIQGETGTGKELAARAIHARSKRNEQAFLSANCAALTHELLQSELFGHKRGAFTGAVSDRKGLFLSADGGTVFLDEVGNASPQLQSSLLRVLQDGEIQRVGETEVRNVDVRVIAATNRDLQNDVRAGSFREDLYYRLRVLTVVMPPLRNRIEDIPLISEHILRQVCAEQNKAVPGFSVDAMRALMEHDWPGNVRELENEIRRAVALVEEEKEISPSLFADTIGISEPWQASQEGYFKSRMASLARRMILEALDQCGDNITRAAVRLGLSRNGLQKMMTRYGLR